MEDFSRPKIIWGEISDRTKFSIDLKGDYVAEATTFLLTGNSLLFLLGFLNSKLSEYIFAKIGTTTGVGTVRWKKFTIEQLKVPKIPSERREEYNDIVNIIISGVPIDKFSELTKLLDRMIYEDFQLSKEEIDFIENLEIV